MDSPDSGLRGDNGAPHTPTAGTRDPHSPHSLPVSTVQALIDQLRPWLQHKYGCGALGYATPHLLIIGAEYPCTCGLAALLASPSLPHAQWQPMETAPKDGRTILVYFPQIGVWAVSWSTAVFDNGFWCVSDNKFEDRPLRGWSEEPTHWMPLPASPSLHRQEQNEK